MDFGNKINKNKSTGFSKILIIFFLGIFLSLSSVFGAFITEWSVGDNDEIKFDVEIGSGDIVVDFGDGNNMTYSSNTQVQHTYATARNYNVSITGDLGRFYFGTIGITFASKLQKVHDWGNMDWTSFKEMFSNAENLVSLPNDAPNLARVTDMSEAFESTTNFNQSLNHWNVSSVTNMNSMFKSSGFNEEIGNWDVSSVTNMANMFQDATNFNQNINTWNVSSVTTMNGMFWQASKFNQPLDNWNVSSVTDIGDMFAEATDFNKNINNWDISSVRTIYNMFKDASSFNQPLDKWEFSGTISLSNMFNGASNFNQNISGWKVNSVTNMESMFKGASEFNQDISGWTLSSLWVMTDMFNGATDFKQDLNNWAIATGTDLGNIFASSSIDGTDVTNWFIKDLSSDNINGGSIGDVIGAIEKKNNNIVVTYTINDSRFTIDQNNIKLNTSEIGSFPVEISYTSDDLGKPLSGSRDFTITVTTPISFTSGPSINMNENIKLTGYIASATTSTFAATIDSYTIDTSYEDGNKFNIDSNTGNLTFKTAPDFEVPDSVDGDNTYEVKIIAEDSNGAKGSKEVSVTINDINDEIPALTVSSNTTTNLESTTSYSFDLSTSFSDKDAGTVLTYYLIGADSNNFTLNGNQLSPNLPFDYENPSDSDKDNSYEVKVIANDNKHNSTEFTFIYNVTDVNDERPAFKNLNVSSVVEGSTNTGYTPNITDDVAPNSHTYTLTGTDATKFNINQSTGVLTFKNVSVYNSTDVSKNSYFVDVTVNDGSFTNTQNVEIKVTKKQTTTSSSSGSSSSSRQRRRARETYEEMSYNEQEEFLEEFNAEEISEIKQMDKEENIDTEIVDYYNRRTDNDVKRIMENENLQNEENMLKESITSFKTFSYYSERSRKEKTLVEREITLNESNLENSVIEIIEILPEGKVTSSILEEYSNIELIENGTAFKFEINTSELSNENYNFSYFVDEELSISDVEEIGTIVKVKKKKAEVSKPKTSTPSTTIETPRKEETLEQTTTIETEKKVEKKTNVIAKVFESIGSFFGKLFGRK